jgi:hypothetical protein
VGAGAEHVLFGGLADTHGFTTPGRAGLFAYIASPLVRVNVSENHLLHTESAICQP